MLIITWSGPNMLELRGNAGGSKTAVISKISHTNYFAVQHSSNLLLMLLAARLWTLGVSTRGLFFHFGILVML